MLNNTCMDCGDWQGLDWGTLGVKAAGVLFVAGVTLMALYGCAAAVHVTPWNDVHMDQAQYMPGVQFVVTLRRK